MMGWRAYRSSLSLQWSAAVLAFLLCAKPAFAQSESSRDSANPHTPVVQRANGYEGPSEPGCVASSTALASVGPAVLFLIIAAIVGGKGGGGGGGSWGDSSKKTPFRDFSVNRCDRIIPSWHVAGSGGNTFGANTPLMGRGNFHVGFSYRDFEYATHAGAGRLDVIDALAEQDDFATFGGSLRYFPMGIKHQSKLLGRPYLTGTGIIGWNPRGPEAKILEYGTGLELGYGFRKNEFAVYGEGQITHVNAGGQGISAVEDNWTWAPSLTLGLRFRWYK